MKNLLKKQQNNTNNFLTSYEIRKQLCEACGSDEKYSHETSANIPLASVAEFDKKLEVGQVRLLTDVNEVTYILLLKKWDDDSFLVTAFSHYNFPATNEELSLGCYAGAYLNVLQIWNTRTLRNPILQKSWICGTLSERVCDEAWLFWNSMINGSQLSDDILSRTGTPIEDIEDIRIQYMREEISIWEKIDADDLATEDADDLSDEESSVLSFSIFDDYKLMIPKLWESEGYSLAAADECDNIYLDCSLYERSEIIKVAYSPGENKLILNIFDNGKRTSSLDNAEVIDVNEISLGTIRNGQCFITGLDNFDARFALRLENGEIVLLSCE